MTVSIEVVFRNSERTANFYLDSAKELNSIGKALEADENWVMVYQPKSAGRDSTLLLNLKEIISIRTT